MSISSHGTSVVWLTVLVPAPASVLSFGQAYAARLIWANSNTAALTALIRLSQTRFIRKGVDIPLMRIPKLDSGLNGIVLEVLLESEPGHKTDLRFTDRRALHSVYPRVILS